MVFYQGEKDGGTMIKEIYIPAVLATLTVMAWFLSKKEKVSDIFLSIGKQTPITLRQSYARYTDMLGLDIKPELIAGLKYGLTFGGLLLTVLFSLGQQFILGSTFLILSFLAWVLPAQWLKQKEAQRQNDIDREFPIMLDLLQIFSESSDLFQALRMLPDVIQGELQRQLLILKGELVTYPLKIALDNFSERCKHQQAKSFISVLQFGIVTGSDVSDILSTFATRTQNTRINTMKRKIKAQPILMTVIPAFMMWALLLLFVVPMFTNIIHQLNRYG